MRRRIGKHIKQGLRQINEDLQVLQKQLRHKSVYSKRISIQENRRPKHRKRFDIQAT